MKDLFGKFKVNLKKRFVEYKHAKKKNYQSRKELMFCYGISGTNIVPDCIAQLVMCLTADPGIVSLISARSYTFV